MKKIKPPKSSELATIVEQYSPLLKEIRKRIILTLYLFIIAAFVGFISYEKIVGFLVGTLSLDGLNIVFTSPFQFINLAFSCGLTTGLVVAFPFFIAQVIHFLKPALKKPEYKLILRATPFSVFLFIIGFSFGAFIMKWQIKIFLERSLALGIGNILDISGLLSTILIASIILGISFQFPIVLLLLLRLKIVEHKQVSQKRRWVYLITFLFTILLPFDSILTDILLSLPLIFLFESTLFIGRFIVPSTPKTK